MTDFGNAYVLINNFEVAQGKEQEAYEFWQKKPPILCSSKTAIWARSCTKAFVQTASFCMSMWRFGQVLTIFKRR